MTDWLQILNTDAVSALADMPEKSVQLVVTSPPYDRLRSYGGHDWDFNGTALQLFRVLCDGGICCWVVGDETVDGSETLSSFRQAIYFKDVCGFRMHDTMIYSKSNFSAPESVRYHQAWEYIFILSKGKPRVFNPIKDKANIWAGCHPLGQNTKREQNGKMTVKKRTTYADTGMRKNIWHGNTRGQENPCKSLPHPAMMPKWLARDLIRSWSNPGDLVVDPMCGSGTTGFEAIQLGRRAWLNDVNAEYVELAKKTTSAARPPMF